MQGTVSMTLLHSPQHRRFHQLVADRSRRLHDKRAPLVVSLCGVFVRNWRVPGLSGGWGRRAGARPGRRTGSQSHAAAARQRSGPPRHPGPAAAQTVAQLPSAAQTAARPSSTCRLPQPHCPSLFSTACMWCYRSGFPFQQSMHVILQE